MVIRLAGDRSLLEVAGFLTDEQAVEPVLTRTVDDFERLEGVDVETY